MRGRTPFLPGPLTAPRSQPWRSASPSSSSSSLSSWATLSIRRAGLSRPSMIRRGDTFGWLLGCVAAPPPTCLSTAAAFSGALTSAVRLYHRTCVCRGGQDGAAACATAAGATESVTAAAATAATDASLDYDQERHIENAEALLREVFGPQAKLVLQHLPQRRHRHPSPTADTANEKQMESEEQSEEDVDGDHGGAPETTAPAAPSHSSSPADQPSMVSPPTSQHFYYRASATFRLLGFPVELAVANGPRNKETIDSCLRQALASDIPFIRPSGNKQSSSGGHTSKMQGNRAHNQGSRGHHHSNTSKDRQTHHNKETAATAGDERGGVNRRQSDSSATRRRHDHKNNQKKGWGRQQQQHAHQHSNTGFRPRAPPLSPHQLELKAIIDDLRQLCVHFSHSIKFSIKPPSQRGRREQPAEEESASSPAASAADKQWRCRGYVKEEWSTVPFARLAAETAGSSPQDALVRCITELRDTYRQEMDSPAVLQEGVREVAGLVQSQHKKVTASCTAEPLHHPASSPSGSGGATDGAESAALSADAAAAATDGAELLVGRPTYQVQLTVTDAFDNVASYWVRRQATPYLAYETAAAAALRQEKMWDRDAHLLSEGLTTVPLLWRLRWQFSMMVDHICRETGQAAAEVAWIRLAGDSGADADASGSTSGSASSSDGHEEGGAAASDSITTGPAASGRRTEDASSAGDSLTGQLLVGSSAVPLLPRRFTGELFSERETLVWRTAGAGRYRVELDTYVQAMYHLLDQYGDCISTMPCLSAGLGEGLLFPHPSVLDLHVHRHDNFPVLQHHRGNMTCYALLGTLTQQLLGCPYTTHYHYDSITKEHVATLTVSDGRRTSQPLIQRRSKRKGEAWRFACLDAIRENFPRQYAAIIDQHPEVDLSSGDVVHSSRMRALPREKRIPYFGTLAAMVLTFAEEDLGWRQARVRLRNGGHDIGLPRWTAELEAQVDGEEGRRTVAVSAAFPQMQQARRSLLFRLGKQYFPKEMAVYLELHRNECVDPEGDGVRSRNKLYVPNGGPHPSMVGQTLALLEAREPTSAPYTFTLEARATPQQRRGSRGRDDDSDDGDDAGGMADFVMSPDDVRGDVSALYTDDVYATLFPPRLSYTAKVLGSKGDVLVADFDTDRATTAADAQAIPVLVTALKSASFHIARGDAETLWTEYETEPLPPVATPGALALHLFNSFLGCSAVSPSLLPTRLGEEGKEEREDEQSVRADYDAPVAVVTTQIGDYWFGTAVLPALGMLPIARAVASTKRRCYLDTLVAAARRSFPRVLQYAIQRDPSVAALATEVLTQPIVDELPRATRRDLLVQVLRKRSSTPLPPFRLLRKCTREAYPDMERLIHVQHSRDAVHGFQYRLYLQRNRILRPGDSQLVGYGVSTASPAVALHHASIMALENLYESALQAAVAVQPSYREPPRVDEYRGQ